MTGIPELSRKQTDGLLKSRLGLARLATSNERGVPHVVPVWFIHLDGRVCIPSPSRSLKTRNVARRPDVSLVVDSYGGVLDAKGVLIEGKAEIVKGAESARINKLVHEKYAGKIRVRRTRWKEFMMEDDVTICVTPSKTRSWDFGRLKL